MKPSPWSAQPTLRLPHTVGERRIWLVTIMLAAPALGFVIGVWPLATLAALAVLVLCVGVGWSREFALGAILATALVMLGVNSLVSIPAAGLLTKGLIGLFALTVLLDVGPRNPLRIPVSLVTLTVVLVVSAIFGAGSRFLALQALTAYLAAPLAYVAVANSTISARSMKRVAIMVVAILVAQLPIVMIQSLFTTNVDRMGGTFGYYGGTSFQAVVMGFAWTAAVALLFGKKRVWLIPALLAISAILLTTRTWGGFVFAAVGTLGVGLARTIGNPKRRSLILLQYAVIGLAAVAVLYVGYEYFVGNARGGLTPSVVTDYLFSHYGPAGEVDRLEGIRLALTQSRTIADLAIGRGVGVLSSSALLGQSSMASSALNATYGWATSATRWLFETGLLGVLLHLVVIGSAVGAVARSWASRKGEWGAAITAAVVGSAGIYVAASLYTTAWQTDTIAVLFWCLVGMAVRSGRLQAVPDERPQPDEPLEEASGA